MDWHRKVNPVNSQAKFEFQRFHFGSYCGQ